MWPDPTPQVCLDRFDQTAAMPSLKTDCGHFFHAVCAQVPPSPLRPIAYARRIRLCSPYTALAALEN